MEVKEQSESPMFVWWDVQSCPVPKGYDALRIYGAIKSAMNKLGFRGRLQVEAVGEGKLVSTDMIHRFVTSGIQFVSVDMEVERGGNQYRIFKCIDKWKTLPFPRGTVVVVISGECGYRPLLRALREESGYRTVTFSTSDWYDVLPLGPLLDPRQFGFAPILEG